MQVVGKKVEHKVFGQGTITNHSGNIVTISFPKEEKKFIYPDAFAKFLTFKNKSAQNEISTICNKKLEMENNRKKVLHEQQEHRQRILALKITPNSQAAFNVDLNDLNEIFSLGNVSTGCYLSGHSKGEPRVPSKLGPNSACLLTGRTPNTPEKERRILGAFMVKDNFLGDVCKNGIVECHDQYQIRLNPNKRMLYWDYFDGSDPLPRWGNTVFKYFSTSTMQRILLDMEKTSQNAEEQVAIHAFYQYFCDINHLPQSTD
ncbi:hypothetical protein [Clostridium sp. C105KSO13]|uniref:hypothetical protein n=1 Tax=Clostridium sp. C105KSO13 TaxID=1776045 RepID=UPI001FA75C41|nr:hypothetical protein [Clostridium sp. C105KSO13]